MPDPKRYEEFSELVRLSTGRILSYVQALLLNWNDTEDLFQETCLVLWERFDEFRPGTSFVAWALRIAQHKVMDLQKKRGRHAVFTANLRNSLMDEAAGHGSETSEASLDALSGCMGRLAENDQQILTLCYIDDIPIRQVADSLGRSPKSVQNSLYRIRKWLLDCIRRELHKIDSPVHARADILKREDGA
jgi:RNA polymerase sigma-70 factor (ECF subfamily)